MNIKKYFIVIVGILSSNLLAQNFVTDYRLENRLSKTVASTPATNSIDRIFVQDKSNTWVGGYRGLSKTTDGGASWTNYYGTSAFGTESVSAINYGLGAIWAATWHNEDRSGSATPIGTGLRYSTDGGQTWIVVSQPVDAAGDSTIIYGVNKLKALPVTAVEQNFIYSIGFTKDAVWIVAFSGGLRKSTDMGKTWQRVVLPPDKLNSIKPTEKLDFDLAPSSGKLGMRGNLNHRAFSIVTIGDTLYVGTAGGINKSTDGGVSWVKFNHTNQANPISGNFVLAMRSNPNDGSIWAATWKAEGADEYYGVSYSKDGGNSWKVTLSDERVRNFGFRTIPTNEIFVASETGLYRSANGSTWTAAPKIRDYQSNVEINQTKFLSVDVNTLNSGTIEVWTGTDDGLAKSIETTTDPWWAKWKVYYASGNSVTTSQSFAFPNPYNPKSGVVRIKYNLNKSSSVTLRVMDFGMNLVRTVMQNASRSQNAEQIDYWDGKDENGKIVPNGVYFYRLDVDGSDPMFGKIIVLM